MNALILAGGVSKRMGQNKALITRPDGTRQIDYITKLLRAFCDQVFLSSKGEVAFETDLPIIEDIHPGKGPVAALEAAAVKCEAPLLVVSCDLFLLDEETLSHLIENRDQTHQATCYKNRLDGCAEPLCTIYEKAGLALATQAIAEDKCSARRFLESLNPCLLELPNPIALDNTNTPEDLTECITKLERGVTSKKIQLNYFAKLREERGIDSEAYETLACTAGGLFEEIRFKHHFSIKSDILKVAINDEFADWSTELQEGDQVVFMTPFAGG